MKESGSDPDFRWLIPILLLLSGCASQMNIPGTGISWDERRDMLAAWPEWQARGRIAVKSGDDGGQGSIRWSQSGGYSRVNLSGPFGAGAYQIAWSDDSVEVMGKAGEVEIAYAGADAAERFLMDQIGWSFPAMSLRYWILGIPDPAVESDQRIDPEGWLTNIRQSGWSIEYEKFELLDETWMPKKIVLENDKARVKVIVDVWKL